MQTQSKTAGQATQVVDTAQHSAIYGTQISHCTRAIPMPSGFRYSKKQIAQLDYYLVDFEGLLEMAAIFLMETVVKKGDKPSIHHTEINFATEFSKLLFQLDGAARHPSPPPGTELQPTLLHLTNKPEAYNLDTFCKMKQIDNLFQHCYASFDVPARLLIEFILKSYTMLNEEQIDNVADLISFIYEFDLK